MFDLPYEKGVNFLQYNKNWAVNRCFRFLMIGIRERDFCSGMVDLQDGISIWIDVCLSICESQYVNIGALFFIPS